MLVALCASRTGLSAWGYVHTRTEGAFTLDVLAWVASWATPASALLGRGKADGGDVPAGRRNRDGGIYNRIPEHYRWVRQGVDSQGRKRDVRFVDIDALDKPETVGALAGMMSTTFPVAKRAAVEAFDRQVRARAEKLPAGSTVAQLRAARERAKAKRAAPP